jgi:hypothetical protein
MEKVLIRGSHFKNLRLIKKWLWDSYPKGLIKMSFYTGSDFTIETPLFNNLTCGRVNS